MNPFILSPQDRLKHWKDFRSNLSKMSEEEQLQRTADYWSLAPLHRIAYDVEDPTTWPTPWEMISRGEWCHNSVAIGAEFTLRLGGWSPDRLHLAMLRDDDLSEMIFVLIIDDTHLINYSHGSVSDYPNTRHDIVNRIRFSGKFYTRTPR